jgi:hypothetical protein
MGNQPLLGAAVQSGDGLTIPKGYDGPMNALPRPSEPILGSTYEK